MSEVTFDFKGKNFAVTGASSGIGKQVVMDLREAGANVLALARRKELMDEIYGSAAPPPYGQVVTARLDVRDQENLDEVLKSFVEEHGKFHGSVYAAGITAEFALRAFDEERAHDVMNTNFFGAVSFLRKLTAAVYTNRSSAHVWIASTAAHTGAKSLSAYSGSKGAMIAALKPLAIEIGSKGHRLNSVSPGWTETEMTKSVVEDSGIERKGVEKVILGVGQPADVSGMILFLLSERAKWITGTDVVIDGGLLTR